MKQNAPIAGRASACRAVEQCCDEPLGRAIGEKQNRLLLPMDQQELPSLLRLLHQYTTAESNPSSSHLH